MSEYSSSFPIPGPPQPEIMAVTLDWALASLDAAINGCTVESVTATHEVDGDQGHAVRVVVVVARSEDDD